LLDSALKSESLDLSDVNIIGCTLERHFECFNNNDALVTFEPIRTQLLSQGAVSLFDSSKIPGKIIDVMVVNKKSILPHTKTLSLLLKGYFKAKLKLQQRSKPTIKVFSRVMQMPLEQTMSIFDGIKLIDAVQNKYLLSGNPSPIENTAGQLFSFMLERKLLKKNHTISKFSDDRFVPDI